MLQTIGMQIAWAMLEPVLFTAISASVSWLLLQWNKWFRYQWDEKNRLALQSALENGVRAGLQALKEHQGSAYLTSSNRSLVLDHAKAYVESSVPGAVKHFKLGPEKIRELAVPHLPLK